MKKFWIIEPHHDDAVYSIGGMLQSACFQERVKLITIFSESKIFNPRFISIEAREEIRKRESQKVADELGVEWVPIGMRDEDLTNVEIDEDNLYNRLFDIIRNLLDEDEIVFLPAGFGENPHHKIVKRLREKYTNHILYEDTVPVASYSRIMDVFLPLYNQLFREYAPHYFDISPFIDRKVDLASIYESQFSKVCCCSLKEHAHNVALFAWHTDYCDNSLKYAERIYLPRNRAEFLLKSLLGREGHCSPSSLTVPLASTADKLQFSRKTSRNLFGTQIDFKDLSELLKRGAAELGSYKYCGNNYSHLTYPTAGGLENSEIYVLAFNVSRTTPGVYKYNPHNFTLIQYSSIPGIIEFTSMIEEQEWGLGTSFAVIINSRSTELHQKYGSRAVQLALIEGGHICQNLLLSAESLGMNAVEIGGFSKQEIRKKLGIINPTALLLFSTNNREVRKASHIKVLLDDLPGFPCYIAEDGVNTRDESASMNKPSFVNFETDVKRYHAGKLGLWVSRTKVPLKNHYATGAGLFTSENEGLVAKELSIIKSEAEAEEIFCSFSAVPSSLVFTSYNELKTRGRVVNANKVILDFIQRGKEEKGLTEKCFNFDEEYHFVAGVDMLDGVNLWCPADSILISKRFWDQLLWPSSTGYCCASSLSVALSHSVGELVEKILIPKLITLKMMMDNQIKEEAIQRILHELRCKLPDIQVFFATLKPFTLVFLRTEERGLFGSSVAIRIEDAFRKAAEEILAKLFEGGQEESPNFFWEIQKENAYQNSITLRELLNSNGLSIGYTYFSSVLRSKNIITKAFVYETE